MDDSDSAKIARAAVTPWSLPDHPDLSSACQASAITYVLLTNNVWAKLYRTVFPFDELELILHQVSFTTNRAYNPVNGSILTPVVVPGAALPDEPIVTSLLRMLDAEFIAGRFEALAIVTTPACLPAIGVALDKSPIKPVLVESAPSPVRHRETELTATVFRLWARGE